MKCETADGHGARPPLTLGAHPVTMTLLSTSAGLANEWTVISI
jgi:hypothetical protein